MRTRTLLAVTIIAAGLMMLPCDLAGQAQAPWFGVWKLNLTKSTEKPGATRFKRVTSRIEPWDDGLKVIYDTVGLRGELTHMEWIGKFDGKDYAVQGVDYVLTNAYSRIDDRSYRIVVKVDGKVAATATVAVSTDGKTLTTVSTEKNARGQNIDTTTVYNRQ